MKIDFSIVIATYNPNYKKLFYTINSIINQHNCEYEIIITDDGSVDFDSDTIKKYFEKNGFKKYLILDNKKNEGTVKNFIKGIEKAKGKYIKLLSPGDYLYSDNILSDIKKYFYDKKSKMLFGKAVYYFTKDDKIVLKNRANPKNPSLFNKKNCKNKLLKNYIYFQDYILGAATVCEKELLLLYLKKIQDKIIYLEDLSYLYMLIDGVEISYFDKYIIWYECSTGISNNKELSFESKTQKDIIACNKEIAESDDFLKRYAKYYFDEKYINNIFFKIKRKIYNKYYMFKNSIFDNTYKNIDISNYNKIIK